MALTAKKVYAILKHQISDMEAKLNSPVRYRGTVATADLLPLNPDIGDMYNIESKSIYGEAGMNVAWNGVVWDTMGAPIDMSLYLTKEGADTTIQNMVNEYLEKNPVKPGATTEQAAQIEQNKTDVASLKKETNSLKEDLIQIEKTFERYPYIDYSEIMENGNIVMSTSGWNYYVSSTRIRTKQGITVFLKKGDIVSCDSYVRCYIGWIANGEYFTKSWITNQDYVLEADGDYVFLVTLNPEADVTISDILKHFNIKKFSSLDIGYIVDVTSEKSRQYVNDNITLISPISRVKTIMHGANAIYPENVLGLYKKSYKERILGWECDVRPCVDGYVLCHDNDIYNHAVNQDGSTISGGTVLISESTVETLKTYKFGVIKGKQNDGVVAGFEDEKIPTLEEFIMMAKCCGATPYVEVKFTPTEQQMKDICDIIKSCGMLEHTYIIAYESAETVVNLALENGIKRLSIIYNGGACTTEDVDAVYNLINAYNLNDVIFNASLAKYTKDIVPYVTSKGMTMGAWTFWQTSSDAYVLKFVDEGVTAFTCNRHNVTELAKKRYF